MADFIHFKSFQDESILNEEILILEENNISYLIEEEKRESNVPLYQVQSPIKSIHLMLLAEDFEQATELLRAESADIMENIDENYYLFAFSEAELWEILKKPDEWNEFDHELAIKLLTEKGHNIDKSELQKLEQARMEELEKPQDASALTILMMFLTLGGIYGIYLAWELESAQITLPNGKKVFAYSEKSRRWGRIGLGTAATLILIVVLRLILWFMA
jgi:hypothetical protein